MAFFSRSVGPQEIPASPPSGPSVSSCRPGVVLVAIKGVRGHGIVSVMVVQFKL